MTFRRGAVYTRQGLAVGETTVGLLRAAMRMLELLDTPEDISFLGPLAHREILYRILQTPQAGRLRAIATSGDLVQRTARAISWLRENYAKPLHMENSLLQQGWVFQHCTINSGLLQG